MESEQLLSEASIGHKTTSNTSGIMKTQAMCTTKAKARRVEIRLGMERLSQLRLTLKIGRLFGTLREISRLRLR